MLVGPVWRSTTNNYLPFNCVTRGIGGNLREPPSKPSMGSDMDAAAIVVGPSTIPVWKSCHTRDYRLLVAAATAPRNHAIGAQTIGCLMPKRSVNVY